VEILIVLLSCSRYKAIKTENLKGEVKMLTTNVMELKENDKFELFGEIVTVKGTELSKSGKTIRFYIQLPEGGYALTTWWRANNKVQKVEE
jgi:hypothetical protein